MSAESLLRSSPRAATIRQTMINLLQQEPLSAMELSEQVGIMVREVYDHLEHIRRSLHREELRLQVLPAECRGCGYRFSKRQRLKRPGRCPICKGESISQPRYWIE